MTHNSEHFKGGRMAREKTTNAEIIRKEVMFGNVRIRCPDDLSEHEVAATLKEFKCPIDGKLLVI